MRRPLQSRAFEFALPAIIETPVSHSTLIMRNGVKFSKTIAALIGALAALAGAAQAQPPILTQDYDMKRSGANLAESTLTPANVSAGTFGKLFAYPVDGEVWAQPLYVPNLSIAGGTHNAVFVATQGNSVFAFDADNAATASTPLWSINLGTPVPAGKMGFLAAGQPLGGIYSTPVIDTSLGALYVVSQLWNPAAQSVSILLHALSLTTGREMFGGPVNVNIPGIDPAVIVQQAALLLLDGTVYVALASHGDVHTNVSNLQPNPYVGYILAYNAYSLKEVGSFNMEPGGTGGGVWQGGRGLASDGRYIYAQVANSITTGTSDYSESFLQLNPVTLSLNDYFRDPDAACLNTLDLDLSSGGPQVIPVAGGKKLLVGGGKEGKIYPLQLNQPLSTQNPAYFWGSANHPTLPAEGGTCADPRQDFHGWLQGSDTAYWNNPNGASYFYALANYDNLYSWQVSGTTFTTTSTDTPTSQHPNALAVSADGGENGILWVVAALNSSIATFSAYNATPSSGHLNLLWSSTQTPTRDILGTLGKYAVPTIANGKAYVGTASFQVAVYGLLPNTPSVQVIPANPTITSTALNPIPQNVYVRPLGGYKGPVTLAVSGLPPGVTYSFAEPSVTITATTTQITDRLTLSPANAVLPLNDNYTLVITASGTDGVIATAPFRLSMRYAIYTSESKAACNAQEEMSANLAWRISGASGPAIWVQDSASPNWPGRLWIDTQDGTGTGQTPFSIKYSTPLSFWWIIDQSGGIAPSLDNALTAINLRPLYSCP